MNNEEKKGLEIVEEDNFKPEEITEEDIEDFYKEHKDAIDLIGGLEIFELLLNTPDEEFNLLKPEILNIFSNTINGEDAKEEFQALIFSENYTIEKIEKDFNEAIDAIDLIDFLSETKKDFLKEIYVIISNRLRKIINQSDSIVYIPCELEENVQIPTYAHKTDAGLDIYAKEEITIGPGETKIIGTGIKVAIPEGYAILIQPRSGQSAKTKLRIANTPGLIDSGYRDEIGVIIENIEPPFKDIDYDMDEEGEIHINSIVHGQAYTIVEGQRFAQMRLVQVPKADFVAVESVGEIGEDRQGGWGSTGI